MRNAQNPPREIPPISRPARFPHVQNRFSTVGMISFRTTVSYERPGLKIRVFARSPPPGMTRIIGGSVPFAMPASIARSAFMRRVHSVWSLSDPCMSTT